GAGSHVAAKIGFGLSQKVLTAALATTAVVGGGVAVVVTQQPDPPVVTTAAVQAPAPAVTTPSTPATRRPSPSKSKTSAKPSPTPSKTPSLKPSSAAPIVIPATDSKKKGVGTWKFAGAKAALADVGAGWYYDWGPNNNDIPGPAGVEYVPMIWGKANATDATIAEAKKESSGELLGFNEPDMGGQANMTVEDALAAWPKLEATGLRLGSPSVAYGGDTAGGWLDRFMAGAKDKGYRVDFITLHWYGSDFSAAAVNQFLGYVDAVHKRYGKPIWVTEFGLMNFSGTPKYPTQAQLVTFINGATKGLESRSWLERYAWFGLPAVGDSVDFGLYKDGDSPTEAGKAYKAAG
ncbi:glycoside hydrolase family protein, partial [Actinoplanes sp. NPDC049596]